MEYLQENLRETKPVSNPALSVYLWDAPPPDNDVLSFFMKDNFREFGVIKPLSSDRIRTFYHYALHVIDLQKKKALYWTPDVKRVPYFHALTPLRTIFHWWLKTKKRFIVHSAAVGLNKGGVLITGKGGVGKSTTALSCFGSKLKYVGDENCIISSVSVPYVYSLYSSGSLDAEDAYKIPFLKPFLANEGRLGREKAVFQLFERGSKGLIKGFPVKAVFVPELSMDKKTRIKERPAPKTLLALAPGSIFQLPDVGNDSLHAMAELLKKVPCYTLELGTNLSEIPAVIESFLNSHL